MKPQYKITGLLLILNLIVTTVSATEKLYDDEIKAGFVYNFIKIVKPVKSLTENYNLCIVGESSIRNVLPELNKQRVHGVNIKTIEVDLNSDISICDSLFLGQVANRKTLDKLLGYAENNSILTMSDVALNGNLDVIFYIKQ